MLTDVHYWQDQHAKHPRPGDAFLREGFLFDPVLSRFLPCSQSLTAIELGCYPGSFLAYLHKRFGYRVYGLDFVPQLERVRGWLGAVGVPVQDLILGDLRTVEFDRTFDVVMSIGLLEHFDDPEEIVDLHCDIVAPGGYVVIAMPNFRGGQYWLHYWFDRDNLLAHNLQAMDLRMLKERIKKHDFEILHANYFRTFDFWTAGHLPPGWRWFGRFKRLLELTRLDNIPNSLFSPYLIVIARNDTHDQSPTSQPASASN